jgi:hypothetical protein
MTIILERRLLVVDASDELQEWVDALTTSAMRGGPDWPSPSHAEMPTRVATVAAVWRAIEDNFENQDERWSVATLGLPLLEIEGRTFGVTATSGILGAENPNSGSRWHNSLHSLLGDFHD